MLLTQPRLDVRAWLALAVNGPVALLALAVAATNAPPLSLVALAVVMVSTPALALAVRALKASERGWGERMELRPATLFDHLLLIAFFLGLASACGLLLRTAIDYRLEDAPIVWGLGVAGPPVGLIIALYIAGHAVRPAQGLRADEGGLQIIATGEVLAWDAIEKISLRPRLTRLAEIRIVARHASGVLVVRRVPAPIGFPPGALPRLLGYAKARMAGLEPASLTQALQEPDARRWQRAVKRSVDEHLEEMAREAKARADVAGRKAGLGGEQEGRERQEPVHVGLAGLAADRAPGARADVDEVVDGARGRALGEVEAEAQVLQEARLEAHEDRRPDIRVREGLAQGFEGEESPWMWLALGERPGGHGGGGGEPREGQRIVEQGRGPLAHGLEAGRAELFGHPGAVAGGHPAAGLEHGLQPPRGAAGDVGGVAAMTGREQIDDGAGLPEGPRGEHEGVVDEFHIAKLGGPEAEIQPPGEDMSEAFEAALDELKTLLADYQASLVTPRTKAA